mmetsp:Transcript_21795/g.36458  ORF Transcript_21795/g.36458 Transcript_21795/m.36458 type:complete len:103 (+) Transcript_21795:76-384(+)
MTFAVMQFLLLGVISSVLFTVINAQGTEIEFTVDTGEGLIYFLLIFFFSLNFGTPILRWLYVNYVSKWVEKAGKEVTKMSKRFSERMSDAGRKVTQSIRQDK